MFHALTGCDTVSSFVGHGKKTAWAVWNSFPDLTNVLLQMATAPDKIQDECLHVVERFVILLYDKTSTITDVNKVRKKIFAKTTSVQRIPPTYAALQQLVKRAVYQGGHVWGNVRVLSRSQDPFSKSLGMEKDRLWDLSTILDHP